MIYPRSPTLEGIQWLFTRIAELADRGEKLAWWVDLSATNGAEISALQRRAGAEVYAAHRARLGRVSICEARVVRGHVMQMVATAFDWIAPRDWPCQNFTSAADALAFCERECRRVGVAF